MRTDPEATSQGLGRRPKVSGVEQDVHTDWRRWYCYTQRAGVCKGVKRMSNRRDRRVERRAIREGVTA